MKKILFVINTMGRAGAEKAIIELLNRINRSEYQCDLFVLTGLGDLISEIPDNVNVINSSYDSSSVLDKSGRKKLLKLVIKSLLKRGNIFRLFPYLFVNFFDMLFHGRLAIDKLLWRVLSNGAERFEENSYDLAVAYIEGGSAYYVADHVWAKTKVAFFHSNYLMGGYSRKLDKNVYLKFDKVFTVSKEAETAFLQAYPEINGKTEVFENFLDIEGIKNKSENGLGFNETYDGKRLLTVGRLTEAKGLDVSIEACRILKQQGEKFRWYVLGEGDLRTYLEKLVKEKDVSDCFVFLGSVANPYVYMKQADIYVHCSRYEGKSIAIQEAQILGKPMIVSDCNGNREQVENEKDGLICSFNPEKIAESITVLLHDEIKCQKYGKAAAAKIKDNDERLHRLLALAGD